MENLDQGHILPIQGERLRRLHKYGLLARLWLETGGRYASLSLSLRISGRYASPTETFFNLCYLFLSGSHVFGWSCDPDEKLKER